MTATAPDLGIAPDRLSGTIQADILKEYIAQKEWCFPVDPAMRLCGDMIEWCTTDVPRWHPVSISGYHIREAGSTAAQELDFFEEIAKYRAARRIWARELRETFGAVNPKSWLMRFHTQTAGVSLTAQQRNNITHETGVTNTIDPLGGSYVVEALTDRLEASASIAVRVTSSASTASRAGAMPTSRRCGSTRLSSASSSTASSASAPAAADAPSRPPSPTCATTQRAQR